MKKKSGGKSKQSRARAVKDLPVSDAKARQAKGGFLGGIGKGLGGVIKTVAPAVTTAVAPTTPS